jgi:hypothetical protein
MVTSEETQQPTWRIRMLQWKYSAIVSDKTSVL